MEVNVVMVDKNKGNRGSRRVPIMKPYPRAAISSIDVMSYVNRPRS